MIKIVKVIIPNININEINYGDEIHNNIGGDDVSSVEEAEMRSSADSVNDNNEYLFCGFDASTCSSDSVYDIFRMGKILLLRILLIGSTLIDLFQSKTST